MSSIRVTKVLREEARRILFEGVEGEGEDERVVSFHVARSTGAVDMARRVRDGATNVEVEIADPMKN